MSASPAASSSSSDDAYTGGRTPAAQRLAASRPRVLSQPPPPVPAATPVPVRHARELAANPILAQASALRSSVEMPKQHTVEQVGFETGGNRWF